MDIHSSRSTATSVDLGGAARGPAEGGEEAELHSSSPLLSRRSNASQASRASQASHGSRVSHWEGSVRLSVEDRTEYHACVRVMNAIETKGWKIRRRFEQTTRLGVETIVRTKLNVAELLEVLADFDLALDEATSRRIFGQFAEAGVGLTFSQVCRIIVDRINFHTSREKTGLGPTPNFFREEPRQKIFNGRQVGLREARRDGVCGGAGVPAAADSSSTEGE